MPTTSPLERLTQLLDSLHIANELTDTAPLRGFQTRDMKINSPSQVEQMNNAEVGDVLCLALGRSFPGPAAEGFDALSKQEAYLLLMKLSWDAKVFVYDKSGDRARSLNMRKLLRVEDFINAHNALSPVNAFREPQLPREFLEELHALADNLADRNTETLIGEDEQVQIRDLLAALNDKLLDADIQTELKARMFFLLEELQAVVTRLRFVSPEELISRLDQFMGVATMAAVTATPEQKNSVRDFFNSSVATIGQIVTLVDHGQKLAPLLVAAAEKLNILGM